MNTVCTSILLNFHCWNILSVYTFFVFSFVFISFVIFLINSILLALKMKDCQLWYTNICYKTTIWTIRISFKCKITYFNQISNVNYNLNVYWLLKLTYFFVNYKKITNNITFIFRSIQQISIYIYLFHFYSDYLFKLLLIGDSGVGKSCLLLRFAVSISYLFYPHFLMDIEIIGFSSSFCLGRHIHRKLYQHHWCRFCKY